ALGPVEAQLLHERLVVMAHARLDTGGGIHGVDVRRRGRVAEGRQDAAILHGLEGAEGQAMRELAYLARGPVPTEEFFLRLPIRGEEDAALHEMELPRAEVRVLRGPGDLGGGAVVDPQLELVALVAGH